MENLITLSTVKTGRVFTIGNDKNPERIWIALHGYGQLATFFIRKFSVLDNGKNLVVCPEGLHRFYVQGHSGRVGASWMTKESRLDDIRDNNNWLNNVYREFAEKFAGVEVVLLGFSQGAATAVRWLSQFRFPIQHLVVYASVFPPDITPVSAIEGAVNGHVYFVSGNQDELMNEIQCQEQVKLLSQSVRSVQFISFDGGHIIDAAALLQLEKHMDSGFSY